MKWSIMSVELVAGRQITPLNNAKFGKGLRVANYKTRLLLTQYSPLASNFLNLCDKKPKAACVFS